MATIVENVDSCRDALHLAVDLLNLDTSANMLQMLQALDKKLTDGVDSITTTLASVTIDIGQVNDTVTDIKKAAILTPHDAALISTLAWLSPTDYSKQLHDFTSRHAAGTGQWFLASPEFIA